MKNGKRSALYVWLAIVCFTFIYFAGSEFLIWQQKKTGEFQMSHAGVLVALAGIGLVLFASLKISETVRTKLSSYCAKVINRAFVSQGIPLAIAPIIESYIDPAELPDELHTANIAFRAVTNGYGDKTATFKNRLTEYLEKNYPSLNAETVKRIAIIANRDKSPGRKKSIQQ